MIQPLIVTRDFKHITEAAYSQLERTISFTKYELVHLAGDPHFIDPFGWYVPLANDHCTFQISSYKIDEYYEAGYLKTYDDLVLQKNYLQYKIDQALDHFSPSQFEQGVQKLLEVDQMLMKYEDMNKPIAQ
ncbi:hypothetical protein [Halobacillus sp. Marseille-Q1614]|uniref:hypothetical protein n=1 Tax=Halobacillus sp. Marseille-Q1614 TaxID=2709134 RepID=UPI00156D859F|nr:hypothetical protein [Halobacillus sp. Marseille-Q1614]